MQYLPQPPPQPEVAASVPAPDENSVFVPGTWVFQDTRFVWRPGYWCDYRPGWVYVPARYTWTPCGYVFRDGYWDFDLAGRGLLFSPVVVGPAFIGRPSWVYTPTCVVNWGCLLGAMFVRPRCGHYYFGDYFSPIYARRGFVGLVDFRVNRSCYDPIYSYYRWHNRNDLQWDRNLRGMYVGRYRGDIPRPPRTLVQQNTLIQNFTTNNVNVTNIRMVSQLNQIDRSKVNLVQIDQRRREQERREGERLREVSRQRDQLERQFVTRGGPPSRSEGSPHIAKINLPPPRPVSRTVTPPPTPKRPEPSVDPKGGPQG
jgi:hypothetical protein